MGILKSHHTLQKVEELCKEQLVAGAEDKNHNFHQVALATSNGAPNARMVILRKAEINPLKVYVYTDSRSDKISEIKKSKDAVFLFWDSSSKLQLKLITEVSIHHNDELAGQEWKKVKGPGKRSYNTAKAPGTSENVKTAPSMKLREESDDTYFCVLECEVVEMEALQLRQEGHIRARFYYKFQKENSFIVP